MAVAGVLLLIVIGTGGATSPAVLLLAASLVFLLRFARPPVSLPVAGTAAAALTLPAVLSGDDVARSLIMAAGLLAVISAGLVWRREERRTAKSLNQLDDILDQASRGASAPASVAAAELVDLELVLGAIADRLRSQEVVLWDVDGERGVARPRAGSRGHPAVRTRLAGDPLGWVWDQGMRMRVEPAPRWARPDQVVIADLLLRDDDETQGMLATYAFDPADVPADDHAFDEAAVYLRGVLSLHAARAGVEDRQRRLTALLAGLKRIPGEMELDALAADLCVTAMTMTDATGAVVCTWSGDAGQVLAVAGADGGPRPGNSFMAPESELTLAVRADTMLIRTAADWKPGRTCIANPDEVWTDRPKAMAALPLRSTTGVIGVLAVWTSRSRRLEEDGLNLLHTLAPYAALHMERARAFGHLRESAERDPLTKLRNRRAFEKILEGETVRFERYGHRLAMLVLDLDHFKAVNDTFGHEAGDEVLRHVARVISGSVRDVDTAARIGGEEFVVLLPETAMPAAVDVAERIRAAVAAATIEWKGTIIPVRVSVGVSACPGTAEHPRELLGTADAALYAAKSAGRDRVVRASPETRAARRPPGTTLTDGPVMDSTPAARVATDRAPEDDAAADRAPADHAPAPAREV